MSDMRGGLPSMYDLPLVYVAGPYTTPDPISNTRNAIEVADELMTHGSVACHVPHLTMLWHLVCPHDDINYWYQYDLAMLDRCDALLRLPGVSTGADAEVAFADERGIPIFHDADEMLAAVNEGLKRR